ncbi:vacuole protein [Leucosporidium creatinivorum]|uniref:Vacuole protein n=1 Tax=Leucosporidium creatinivorum TaxID=106004 RepID=A0A1Y2EWS5_9BASI|nr:vacuole protein [Leucosporidium creatinivorum]
MAAKRPTGAAAPLPSSSSRGRQLALSLAPLFLLPLLYSSGVTKSLTRLSSYISPSQEPTVLVSKPIASCPVQVEPRSIGVDWRPEDDKEYVRKAVERLQGAVRIPTESFDDMAEDAEQEPRFKIMLQLHDYLENTFPLLHVQVERERVAGYGLLYTWKGSDPSLKPIALMAHQDVVPVNRDTVGRWTHDPFSGYLDEQGWIWGRGSADCKNTLVGALSAIEKLCAEGFKPTRTVIVMSGADEEVSGRRTARHLSETLLARYGHHGIALIIDEGPGLDTSYGRPFAHLGLAEKGAVTLDISVHTPGGHSSMPPEHTGIGILSLLLVELEKNPFPPMLREGNPMLSELLCGAEHGTMHPALKARVEDHMEWKQLGVELAKKNPIFRAFLGTSQAIDLVQGGIKVNALPELSTASANYRIDFLSSVNETLTRLTSILAPVVASLEMTLDAFGSHAEATNNVVRLRSRAALEPAPLTPSHGPAFELMSGTVKHVFEGAIVAPSGMIANTDTKWTWNLTRNIYRFVPSTQNLIQGYHTVDERIHTDAHISAIHFFHTLIRNTEGWTDD